MSIARLLKVLLLTDSLCSLFAGTSTHIFRLEKTHPVFETDPQIVRSIKAVTDERGKVLGAVPMEFRSNNFGPPLFCNNRSGFVHLDNRQNKSAAGIYDTQWLFPRDVFRGRGRAYAEENPAFATPSFDQHWRVWKKSDPATTGKVLCCTVRCLRFFARGTSSLVMHCFGQHYGSADEGF